MVSGNSGTHTVAIYDGSGAPSVIISGSVNTSGATAGAFLFVTVADTVLSASTAYFLVSLEASGGDQWYDNDTTLTPTSVATINSAAYFTGPLSGTSGSSNNSYVPVSFRYAGAAAFVAKNSLIVKQAVNRASTY